jgi:hypothetical protein
MLQKLQSVKLLDIEKYNSASLIPLDVGIMVKHNLLWGAHSNWILIAQLTREIICYWHQCSVSDGAITIL